MATGHPRAATRATEAGRLATSCSGGCGRWSTRGRRLKPGALRGRGDQQIRTRQQRVVGEVVLGEPALAEPQLLGQDDLVQHLGVRLVVPHPAPLAVVEQPEVHGGRRVRGV
jgi:hypothetical protein